jgi:hypothetical protein
MPIFSRRVIQDLIDGTPAFLLDSQIAKFVTDLNGHPTETIQWEWELALLSAMSKLGTLKYERSLGGKTNPDILFSLRAPQTGFFLAEITTVSDKSADEENPIEELQIELSRLVKKRGLQPNHFSVSIGDDWQGIFHSGRKPRLKIPRKREFKSAVFTPKFDSFLSDIRGSPREARAYEVKTGHVDLTISYDHRREFFSASHMSYDVPYSLERNTVFKALDKKARQLRLSGCYSPLGIFLCDGGCHLLASSPRTFEITADDVIRRFLRMHPFISFVQVFVIAVKWDMAWGTRSLALQSRLFEGHDFQRLPLALREVLPKVVAHMPKPENDPDSARATLMRWPETRGYSFRGGCTMTYKSAKFSARGLLDLLAGRLDQREFLHQYGFTFGKESLPRPNFFEILLRDGRLIAGIEIERCPEKDDDWITITFSDPDPAVSKFVPPRQKENT